MSSISGHAISSGLHNARLPDLLHFLSGCWTMLTSFQGACCPLKHNHIWSCFQDATLFDLNHLMLRRFATLHTSCCLLFSTSHFCFLIVRSGFHDATLFGVLYLMLHCLTLTASCYAVSSCTSPACCLILAS